MDTYVDEIDAEVDYGADEVVTDTYDYGYAYSPTPEAVVVSEERVYYDDELQVPIAATTEQDTDESFEYREEWSEFPDLADSNVPDEETKVNISWTEDDVGDSADVWMPSDALIDGDGYDGPDIFVGIGDAGAMRQRWCELQPWECADGANGTGKDGLLTGDLGRLWGAYDATGILLAVLLLLLLLIGLNIGWDSEVSLRCEPHERMEADFECGLIYQLEDGMDGDGNVKVKVKTESKVGSPLTVKT
jgi:hypothetical protein